MGILKLPEKPKVVCGFQVPTQLKNILPCSTLVQAASGIPHARGAAGKSGVGVLPCCLCLLEAPKQSPKPAADHGQKSTQGMGISLCAHPLPAARGHPTAPATERLGSTVGPESKGGSCCPISQLLAPYEGMGLGQIRGEHMGKEGSHGSSPGTGQQGTRCEAGRLRCRVGSRAIPCWGQRVRWGGCCRVVDGSYLASPCPTATPARGLRCSAPVGGCDCPQGAPGAWWRRARAAEPLGDFLGWGHLCPWGTLLLGCCCGVWGILERAQP